jgi:hypothetical protein
MATECAAVAVRWASIRLNTGSAKPEGAAEADAAGIVASAARMEPPAATPAACERNRRRVETAGVVVLFSALA